MNKISKTKKKHFLRSKISVNHDNLRNIYYLQWIIYIIEVYRYSRYEYIESQNYVIINYLAQSSVSVLWYSDKHYVPEVKNSEIRKHR